MRMASRERTRPDVKEFGIAWKNFGWTCSQSIDKIPCESTYLLENRKQNKAVLLPRNHPLLLFPRQPPTCLVFFGSIAALCVDSRAGPFVFPQLTVNSSVSALRLIRHRLLFHNIPKHRFILHVVCVAQDARFETSVAIYPIAFARLHSRWGPRIGVVQLPSSCHLTQTRNHPCRRRQQRRYVVQSSRLPSLLPFTVNTYCDNTTVRNSSQLFFHARRVISRSLWN